MENDDDDDDGDWLVSHVSKQQTLEDEFDILDEEGEVITNEKSSDDKWRMADEYADMADYEDDNILDDEAAVAPD